MGTKNRPGTYDCYDNAEPDEPMFILLARDETAPGLVRDWADRRRARDGDTDQAREAIACAEAMEAWRARRETLT